MMQGTMKGTRERERLDRKTVRRGSECESSDLSLLISFLPVAMAQRRSKEWTYC